MKHLHPLPFLIGRLFDCSTVIKILYNIRIDKNIRFNITTTKTTTILLNIMPKSYYKLRQVLQIAKLLETVAERKSPEVANYISSLV